MPKIDYAAELNAEQLAAVTAPDGPLLVLAAAGTGKTRTLVYRVAYLVERGVDPRHILLLTFTNRAAREMMERAAVVAGPGVGGVWGLSLSPLALISVQTAIRRMTDRPNKPTASRSLPW